MREQYPFFRDTDEQTQAVVGADAVDADLDGKYQKPYAVLTQNRLYCKNEQGNFITGISNILSVKRVQSASPFGWLFWCAFAILGLYFLYWIYFTPSFFSELNMIRVIDPGSYEANRLGKEVLRHTLSLIIAFVSLIAFLATRKKYPKIAPALLCVWPGYLLLGDTVTALQRSINLPTYFSIMSPIALFSRIVPIVLVVIYYILSKQGNSKLEILHTDGNFSFPVKNYPAEELKNFEAQVKALTGKNDGR